MAYHNEVFPTNISHGSKGGPGFKTDVIVFGSGSEKRNIDWAKTQCKYNVAWGIHLNEDITTLLNFFRARMGMAHSFPYKDWGDFEGTGELIGTGDAVETQFQLIKTYDSGGYDDYVRDITKPKPGTVKIYIDAVEQTSGWSIDPLTGIVTFTAAPGDTLLITADYEFYVPCRFDTDYFPISLDYYEAHSMPDVPVIEDKDY